MSSFEPGTPREEKPRIAILLALYEPRLDWLRELLSSLEGQTYPNLKLYIRDDCSPRTPFREMEKCVEETIASFPWEMRRNEKNLGSNLTFERLTREAEGEYFAYCDQDDIWLPEKLSVLQKALEDSGALLACSDMRIIDAQGRQTADSILKVRRHHVFRSGEGLAPGLLISNFVTGCTMLARAQLCQEAVPFCPYMVHDQYLALWCAERGSILSLSQALICYRIHGGNQSAAMAGVSDKKSYGRLRIDLAYNRLCWLRDHFPCGPDTEAAIEEGIVWASARKRHWAGRGGSGEIWRFRRLSPLTSLFEIFAVAFPNWLFMWFIGLKKKNVL